MDELSDQAVQRASQILTTEHFTLQGARNATVSDANGRLGHYMSAVGSGVVALAFVANVSEIGLIFLAFSSAIFPIMIILGVVTMIRTLQIAVDFVRLTQAINRIRHYYTEVAPEVEQYISFPRFDDPETVQKSVTPVHSSLQDLASTPGPVMLINSVLVGAFAGILANGFFAAEIGLAIVVALVALVVAFVLHRFYVHRFWEQWARQAPEIRFPSPQS